MNVQTASALLFAVVPARVQAHRLVLLAEQKGRAGEAEELLFQAIYERGRNVSDTTTLNALGQELGLTGVSSFTKPLHGLNTDHSVSPKRLG